MAYTFSGQTSNTVDSGTDSISVSMSIGGTANPFVVVGIILGGITTVSPTVTVGSSTLSLITNDSSTETLLFGGSVTGSGIQTITFNAGTQIGFVTVGFALWYTPSATAGNTLAISSTQSGTISVTSGQYLFGMTAAAGTATSVFNYGDSTQALNINAITSYNADAIGVVAETIDCTVSSTGTFTVSNAAAGNAIFASIGAFTPSSNPPVVTGSSINLTSQFASGGSIGTITATNTPTAFSITAGDPAGDFKINASGVISTVQNLNGFGSETLTVQATNAGGSGTGAVTVAWAPSIIAVNALTTNAGFAKTATFTNAPLGTATPDRITYLVIGQNSSNFNDIASVTIAGVNATRAVRTVTGTVTAVGLSIEGWYANTVSGTAGNIVVTSGNIFTGGTGGSIDLLSLAIYAITGCGTSPTPFSTSTLFQQLTDPCVLPLLSEYPGSVGVAGFMSSRFFTPITWNTPTSGDLTVNSGSGLTGDVANCQIMTAHFTATTSTSISPSESGGGSFEGFTFGVGVVFPPSNISTSPPIIQNTALGPMLAI